MQNYHYSKFFKILTITLGLSLCAALSTQAATTYPAQKIPFDPNSVTGIAKNSTPYLSSIGLLHLGSNDPVSITINIINVILTFLGLGFLILLVYAGVNWLLSQGNDEKITKSKQLIIRSIVGFIIVVSALAVSQFVYSVIAYYTVSPTT